MSSLCLCVLSKDCFWLLTLPTLTIHWCIRGLKTPFSLDPRGSVFFFPIGSMYGLFTYIYVISLSHSCRQIYQSHGSYGFESWNHSFSFFWGEPFPLKDKSFTFRGGGGERSFPPVHSLCSSMSLFFYVFWISRQRKIADSTWYLEWNLFPIFLFRPLDVPKLFALHAEQQTCPCYSVTSMPWRHGHPNVFQAAHDFSKKWKFADLMFIDFGRRLEHWYIYIGLGEHFLSLKLKSMNFIADAWLSTYAWT